MVLDNKTKKYLKIICLLLFIVILTGCTSNLDKSGHLIKSRAITESTTWSLSKGWFDFLLVIPIAKAILFFGNIVGNVAFGVVFTTIFINILTLPIMIKSTVSTQKMQLIQPEIEKIQRKYKGRKDQMSQQKQGAEIQALYKKNDVSMMGSFATFLTFPIMFAMWQSVQRIKILYDTQLFGFNLGEQPLDHVLSFDVSYIILLVVVAATQYFAMEINNIMMKRNPKYQQSTQQGQMKMMNNVMTIMIVYFAAVMPSAMSLYWITTNLINVVRTSYIHIHHIEKARKQVDSANTNYLNKKKKK